MARNSRQPTVTSAAMSSEKTGPPMSAGSSPTTTTPIELIARVRTGP